MSFFLHNALKDSRDDGELFGAMLGSDPEVGRTALAELYLRHAAAVLGFLRRAGGPGVDAEDILHDSFLAAADRCGTFVGDDARAWLLTLALNRLRDVRKIESRRRRRERDSSRPEVATPRAPSSELEEAIAALPAPLREVVALRHVEGLTHEQVARVLGVSLRTAKQRSGDALEQLRQRLKGTR